LNLKKHNDYEGATQLYNEMLSLDLVPDLNTINSIIGMIRLDASISSEGRQKLMMKRLTEMRDNGIRPNLRTFNACLNLIRASELNPKSPTLCLDILKEMKMLGIEPSLGTYSHVLSVFYARNETGRNSKVMEQILDRLEKQQDRLEWRDKDDGYFFRVAMEKCDRAASNTNNATRLHAILSSNRNFKFLNDSLSVSRY
jgi:pentatricopeptide repeat domain-containing protein 3